MKFYFQHKVVLITGATSGIGKALAIALLKMDAKVAVCARNEANLLNFKHETNHPNLLTIVADVSKETDCQRFIDESLKAFHQIDILINNAGISMRALFNELDVHILRQSMDVNFWGTVYCSKFALPHVLKTKGVIVGVSSIAGYKGLPCRTGYSASKFAMQGFLESLKIEMLHEGVHVMWVSPGFVASNIRNTALNANGQAQSETPLNEDKLMSAEECAKRILQAIQKRKRTLVMTAQGKLTVWMNKFFPTLVDNMVYKHFANEADSPLKK